MMSAAYLLSDTARLLRRAFDARVRQLGMTSSQARLLLMLDHAEGENQGFYADRLEVEPISLCRLIDRMEEAGLLERRRDPADRRAWRVHLTERSRRVIDEVRAGLAGMEDEMLTGLGQAEREGLIGLLEKVRANFAEGRPAGVLTHG
jgi:DNA-binding MarR family transcriptional regulator